VRNRRTIGGGWGGGASNRREKRGWEEHLGIDPHCTGKEKILSHERGEIACDSLVGTPLKQDQKVGGMVT